MDAEQIIKASLDGTFTRVRHTDGAVITARVPLDYLPDHKPAMAPENCGKRGPGSMKRHTWTPDEDLELVRLRRLGWSKMRCSHAFNVSEDSIRKRIVTLRKINREVF
jgi:hypothetical protein